ncbi:MAG: hypothetical protein ACKOE7_17140, partial [Actinomycetota bacterium]
MLTTLQQFRELFKQPADNRRLRSDRTDLVAASHDAGAGKGLLDDSQQFVTLAKQRSHHMRTG